MTNDEQNEAAIKAMGADVAPRVTPDAIQAAIVSEHYFTAADGAMATQSGLDRHVHGATGVPLPLHLLTLCVLVLRNGFTVVGKSACASPANFNAQLGRSYAREDAVRQLWPLLGYALRDKLANEPSGWLGRLQVEARETDERIEKLQAFLASGAGSLAEGDRRLLEDQYAAMLTYAGVLHQRLAAAGVPA